MTEQERTEMAILKAKSMNKAPKVETSKEQIKKIAKEPKTDIKKYPYEIKLGENKTVSFKPWTGKTKKKFKKIFTNQDIDENDINLKQIVKVLINDQLQEQDVYLSDAEQQYLLAKIREQSIGTGIEFTSFCKYCNEEQNIKTTIKKAVKFKPSTFPFKVENGDLIDIEKSSTLEKAVLELITDNENYDGLTTEGDIVLALHLKLDGTKTTQEVLNKMDEMELVPLKNILDAYDEHIASIEIFIEQDCKKCGELNKFSSEEIPDLYSGLI